jgi:GDP-L-fucose synthase
MQKDAKIFVAGHNGMVGSAIWKNLKNKGYDNLIGLSHAELDLKNQSEVRDFFKFEQPEYVFLAAARVGGILANNKYRANFIYENLQIQNNVIHYSYETEVKKLLFLGSTCIYPKNAEQPIREDSLLTSELEYTNEPYAIAKIAGIKMCESYNLQYGTNFISVMPTNLYGYNDNFDLERSHVLPALLRKILLGKYLMDDNIAAIRGDLQKRSIEGIDGGSSIQDITKILKKYGVFKSENDNSAYVVVWGSGRPKREFLWGDDLADACVYIMQNISFFDLIPSSVKDTSSKGLSPKFKMNTIKTNKEIRNTHINIGSGEEISIVELANLIGNIVKFKGVLKFDTSKPDGAMRKLTNVKKLNKYGWQNKVRLRKGIEMMIDKYINE